MKGLRCKNGLWHVEKQVNGRIYRFALKTRDKEAAIEIAKKIFGDINNGADSLLLFEHIKPFSSVQWVEQLKVDNSWLKRMYKRCRDRSKLKNIPISLTVDDMVELAIHCEGVCSVSGIPLDLSSPEKNNRRPYAPSLDRINPNLGYTLENCRIVCDAVNIGMLHWGEGVLLKIGVSMAAKQIREKIKPPMNRQWEILDIKKEASRQR